MKNSFAFLEKRISPNLFYTVDHLLNVDDNISEVEFRFLFIDRTFVKNHYLKLRTTYLMKLVVFIMMTAFSFTTFAQKQYPNIVPLSPNAAEMNKYGDYSVNALTGRPDINFPIYTIQSGSLKFPISLSYFASGIQVSQLATWCGLGWSLNTGNQITRTVRGMPDEIQFDGWIDDPTTPNEIANASDYVTKRNYADLNKDPSPDFFNYSIPGKTGKFIFRKSSQTFESIPYENIKIIWDQKSSSSDNSFKIVDNDGTKYLFEEKERYFDDNDPQGTPLRLRRYVKSWFLTKVISANNTDTISLTYTVERSSVPNSSGISINSEWLVQKRNTHTYSNYHNRSVSTNLDYFDAGFSESSTYIGGLEPTLKEISFRNGKVLFNSNVARNDYPGNSLDDISIFSGNDLVYKYNFKYNYFIADLAASQYDYRLKLLSFTKTDVKNNSDSETHSFEYNETVKLPSTSSTAQDYWGFYNGRDQGFLMNKPPSNDELSQRFWNVPVGGADRTANDLTIQAGMLKKITYPTKGSSEFIFESNKFKSKSTQQGYISMFSVRLTAKGRNKPVTKIENFKWNNPSGDGIINVYFSPLIGYQPFPLEDAQNVEIRDLTDNRVIFYRYHDNYILSPLNIENKLYFINGHDYKATVTVSDEISETSPVYVTMNLSANQIIDQVNIKSGGGLRINEIRHYDHDSKFLSKEAYQYKSNTDDGIGIYLRSDIDFEKNYYKRSEWFINKDCIQSQSYCECAVDHGNSIIYVGEGVYPQVTLEGASVIYSEVSKTIYGPDGDLNGKSVYSRSSDLYNSTSVYNPNVPGMREYYNNFINSGMPPSEFHYSYNKKNSKYYIKRQKLYDFRLKKASTEEAVNMYRIVFYPASCNVGPNASTTDFTYMSYRLNFGVYKLDTLTEREFDLEGKMILETKSSYFYDNPTHMEVSRVFKKVSDGSLLKTFFKYPSDFTDNSYGSNLLRDKDMSNYLLEQREMRNDKNISKNSTTYNTFQGKVLPDFVQSQMGDSESEIRLKYDSYDLRGNPLQISKMGFLRPVGKRSYIWGYNNFYPIAEVDNADFNNVFFTSFEDGTGNSIVDDCHNGHLSKLNGFVKSINVTSGNYILSYWSKVNEKWILSEQKVVVINGVYEINLTGQIDDVQFYPAEAVMRTFTYDPLIGITSQTDFKGLTTYFEYEGLQRLKHIRDQNKNIITSYKYNFKTAL